MLSFWEKNSFLHHDYIVVGSGIVGLSAACSIKEQQPHASVLVLERGILPTGASTRNAGFACIGSLTELLADLSHSPTPLVLSLLSMRLKGLQKLRERLGDAAIDYRALGSYELISEHELACLEEIERLNTLLRPVLGGDAFSLASHKIGEFGFDKTQVKAMIQNNFEGQLDTGKMMHSLWQYASSLGVMVLTGAEVCSITDSGNGAIVEVNHQILHEKIAFVANKSAIICTNAFAKQFMPNEDITPGRGQVLVTKPIDNLPFKGIFHFDEGYYYFRNYGNRVIFGGGRNLDFTTEATTEIAYNPQILAHLQHQLQTLILPNTPFEVDMHWAGIMAFGTTDKMPILKKISPHIVAGVRLGGMGVAIGSLLGEQIYELLTDDSN